MQPETATGVRVPQARASGRSPQAKASKLALFGRQWDLQLMVIPALLFIFVFSYLPLYGLLIAFQDFDIFSGFFRSEWVGFKHFRIFFESPEFMEVTRNTICISLLKLFITFPAPIALALLLNEVRNMVFKRVVQTISYLPHFFSWVIVAGFFGSMLATDNGSMNIALEKLRLIDEPINFLSLPQYFWTILISANVWKEIGFGSIVYLAAIAGVDPALYEAAAIDGASRFKQVFLVTIPSIMPVVIIFMILAMGNILNAGFEDILLLAKSPSVAEVANVLDTYVYRVGVGNSRYSYATAVGLLKSVINIGLLVLANALAKRTGTSLW